MAQEIYMDITAVRQMGSRFSKMANACKLIASALEVAMHTLKASAFMGAIGTYAASAYIEQFKPVIEKLALKCEEMSTDLADSATAYENGDEIGSARFH